MLTDDQLRAVMTTRHDEFLAGARNWLRDMPQEAMVKLACIFETDAQSPEPIQALRGTFALLGMVTAWQAVLEQEAAEKEIGL